MDNKQRQRQQQQADYNTRLAQKSHCVLRYAESAVTVASIVTSVSLPVVIEGQATLPLTWESPKAASLAQWLPKVAMTRKSFAPGVGTEPNTKGNSDP